MEDQIFSIKDLIYFDQDKASSLYSQFMGGLTKEVQEEREVTEEKNRLNKINLKVFEKDFGGMDSEKFTQMQTKILHHDLLNRVEGFLENNSMLLDLNNATKEGTLDDVLIRELLEDVYYVRAEGTCIINNFDRLKKVMSKFSWLVDFINKCNRYSIEQSEEIKQLKEQIIDIKSQLKQIKDRTDKAKQKALISSVEKKIDERIRLLSESIESPDDWLIEGITEWVNIFNEGQIHLRNKPFDHYQDFEIVCNLKRDHFVEEDLSHILFSYGQNPDIKLTVLGLIASKPNIEIAEPVISREFTEGETGHRKVRNFGNSMINVFDSMEGIEAFGRFVTYPDITLYPLAVYRNIESSKVNAEL